jgi:hypothetical protein
MKLTLFKNLKIALANHAMRWAGISRRCNCKAKEAAQLAMHTHAMEAVDQLIYHITEGHSVINCGQLNHAVVQYAYSRRNYLQACLNKAHGIPSLASLMNRGGVTHGK